MMMSALPASSSEEHIPPSDSLPYNESHAMQYRIVKPVIEKVESNPAIQP